MKLKSQLKKFWNFLKEDTWQSWIVSIVLIIIFIKLIFFPVLTLLTGSPLPLVVIESCSMYHESNFDEWWDKNSAYYEPRDIFKSDFSDFPHKNGLNKGDIILVIEKEEYENGDIIIFQAPTTNPIIHRLISIDPLSTKGDHNTNQLSFETNINQNAILGKATLRLPLIGWVKLVFFEPFWPDHKQGLCR